MMRAIRRPRRPLASRAPAAALLAGWILAGGAGAVRADVVHTTSGESFEGVVVSESDSELVLDLVAGGKVRLRRAEVDRVERKALAPSPRSAPAPDSPPPAEPASVESAPASVRETIDLLGSPDDEARRGAATWLLDQGPQVVGDVLRFLGREDVTGTARGLALRVLGELGDPKGLAPILAGLEHPDAEVRLEACIATADFGAKEAADSLLACLKADPDDVVRRRAAAALRALTRDRKDVDRAGAEAVALAFAHALGDPDWGVREEAKRGLTACAPRPLPTAVVDRLGAVVLAEPGATRVEVRTDAAVLLGELAEDAVLPLALALARDKAQDVRAAAMGSLGAFDDAATRRVLVEALGDRVAAVREQAMRSIRRRRVTEAVPGLIERLDRAKEEGRLVRVAHAALETITGEDLPPSRTKWLKWWASTGRQKFGPTLER